MDVEDKYNPDTLKKLWDIKQYEDIVKAPGQLPDCGFTQARFVMQAKLADETQKLQMKQKELADETQKLQMKQKELAVETKNLASQTHDLQKKLTIATVIMAIATVVMAIATLVNALKPSQPLPSLENQSTTNYSKCFQV